MFRRFATRLGVSYLAVNDRLDAFEKEVIELKAFREAVESTSPEVATAVQNMIKERMKQVSGSAAIQSVPLTAKEFEELNRFYSVQEPKRVLLDDLQFIRQPEDLVRHAAVVHREYLVRIARMVKTCNRAPYGLSLMDSIKELKGSYQWSFHDMKSTPLSADAEGRTKFDHLVRRVFLRHFSASWLLSSGLYQLAQREHWKEITEALMETYKGIEDFFEEVCTERIRLRFLVGNYMYLSTKMLGVKPEDYQSYDPEGFTTPTFFDHDPEEFIGQICKKFSLFTLVKNAIKNAQVEYEDAEIELQMVGDENLTCVGVPYMVYDILSAMLEDAIIANQNRQERGGIPCSKIVVTLAQKDTNKAHTVRVADTAGGIPLTSADKLLTCWSVYKMYEVEHGDHDMNESWTHSPMRLPYARASAKVLGGDMTIASIEGYGTDRQLFLPSTGIEGLSV